jgi:hypothetical protein
MHQNNCSTLHSLIVTSKIIFFHLYSNVGIRVKPSLEHLKMKYRHKSKTHTELSHRVTKQDVNSQLIYMFLTLEVVV